MLRLDHVIYAVRDLDEAAERFLRSHGLASLAGGVHPRWGTGNRVVPFSDGTYIELMAIVDPHAAVTPLGDAISEVLRGGDRWFTLCLADDALDDTAARLDLEISSGSRTRPDGSVISWRSAGIEDPRRTPDLPFFIAWQGPPDAHPAAMWVTHPAGAMGISSVEVSGDPSRFSSWTAGAHLPVHVVDGDGAMRSVTLATAGGDLRLS